MLPQALIPRRRRVLPFSLDDNEITAPLAAPPVNPPLPEPRPARPMVLPTPEPITREPIAIPSAPVVTGPPPLTEVDRRGRPRIMQNVGGDERLEAERQLMEELRNYEPKKRSRLRLIGMSALRGLAAGPGGALSGALWGGLASVVDPTIEDKVWQAEQIRQSEQRQQQIRGEQRYDLQDDLLRAQVLETQAQAEARRNPRPRLVEAVDASGNKVLVPEQAGVVTERPRPAEPTFNVDTPYGTVPAKGGQLLDYLGQTATREATARERESTRQRETTAQQSQRQAFLDEAKTLEGRAANAEAQAKELSDHIAKLEKGMRNYQAGVPGVEGPVTKVEVDDKGNRITRTYPSPLEPFQKQITELKARQQSLLTDAQKWRTDAVSSKAKGEAIPESTPSSTAPPPPPGVTEASIRAEARRRNENEDAAVQRARSFGWIR